MKLRFLVSIASADWAYGVGQLSWVEPELAEKWIASGIAVSAALPRRLEGPQTQKDEA